MIRCGSCGSGVVAQEKFKHQKNGITRRYVYYNCGKTKDFDCRESYIREEDLTQQRAGILDKVSLDQLRIQEKYQRELARFQAFAQSLAVQPATEIDIKACARHILPEGGRDDKRAAPQESGDSPVETSVSLTEVLVEETL